MTAKLMCLSPPLLLATAVLLASSAGGGRPFRTTLANAAQTEKIKAIHITGSKHYAEARIIAESRLHVGDVVNRDDIQAEADRLAQLGPFTSALYRFTTSDGNLTIEFQVQDAPTVPVSFDNFPWYTDGELTAAIQRAAPLFDGTAPQQGTMLDAITAALQDLLNKRGIQASLEHNLLAQPEGDGMMQQFRVSGADMQIESVKFGDALATESKRLQMRLSDLEREPYSRFAIEVFCNEHVRPLYLEAGHLRARIGQAEVRFSGDPNRPLPSTVQVVIPIEPGPVYRWAGVEWRGNAAFGPAALSEFLGLKEGEIADGMKIQGAWQRVQDEYGRRGFLDVKLDAQPAYDSRVGRVSYRVTITEGAPYRMGALVITGLSLTAERKLIETWRIPRGEIFDRVYFDEFVATGIKKAFADMVVHGDLVGHLLRPDPQTHSVEVLLDFH